MVNDININNEAELDSLAAKRLGRKTSIEKAEAGRINVAKARSVLKAQREQAKLSALKNPPIINPIQ